MNGNLKTLHCRRKEKQQRRFAVYLLCAVLFTAVVHWQCAESRAQEAAVLALSLRLEALEQQNAEAPQPPQLQTSRNIPQNIYCLTPKSVKQHGGA